MAHYLLFLPGVSGCDPNVLIEIGLGDLLQDGESPEFQVCPMGPGNQSGSLVTWRTGNTDTDAIFNIHDGQTWYPATKFKHPELGEMEAERFWIGVENERPVQPCDIVRRKTIPGQSVTLADGCSWSLPTISRLPNRFNLNEDGEIARYVKRKYERFYNVGMQVVQNVLEEFSMIEEVRGKIKDIDDYSIPVTLSDGMTLIASALSLNYRLTWELCFLLGLLDEQTGARALMAFCELSQIKNTLDQKKTLQPILINVGWYTSNTNEA